MGTRIVANDKRTVGGRERTATRRRCRTDTRGVIDAAANIPETVPVADLRTVLATGMPGSCRGACAAAGGSGRRSHGPLGCRCSLERTLRRTCLVVPWIVLQMVPGTFPPFRGTATRSMPFFFFEGVFFRIHEYYYTAVRFATGTVRASVLLLWQRRQHRRRRRYRYRYQSNSQDHRKPGCPSHRDLSRLGRGPA